MDQFPVAKVLRGLRTEFYLAAALAATGLLREGTGWLFTLASDMLSTEVVLEASTAAHGNAVLRLVAGHPEWFIGTSRYRLFDPRFLLNSYAGRQHDAVSLRTEYTTIPGTNKTHWLLHPRLGFIALRIHQTRLPVGDTDATITLTALGSGSKQRLFDFIDEARALAAGKDTATFPIFEADTGYSNGTWKLSFSAPKYKQESLIVDLDTFNKFTSDLEQFRTARGWYRQNDIPYKRTYLLYGPPGTGKTSFIRLVASLNGLGVCLLKLSELNPRTLRELLLSLPPRCLLLCEDFDCYIPERHIISNAAEQQPVPTKAATTSARSFRQPEKVTFSDLINVLDGLISDNDGRLIFMTTNVRERLTDAALVRPGRIDVQLPFNFASKDQMLRMFLKFFPGKTEEAARFASGLQEDRYSMAMLQSHFQAHAANGPSVVLDKIHELMQRQEEFEKLTTVEGGKQ